MYGLADIFVILLYVVPGFMALGLRRFLLPTRKPSDFDSLVESVVFSLLSLSVAAGLLTLLGRLGWEPASGYLKNRDGLLWGFSFAIALALGAGFAWLLKSKWFDGLSGKLGIAHTIWPTVWNDVMRIPDGGWVRVRTVGGQQIGGVLRKYSIDPNVEEQALFLTRACYLSEEGQWQRDISGKGVYIRAAAIESVEFVERGGQMSSTE